MLKRINLFIQLAFHLEHQNTFTKFHTMHLAFLLLAGLIPWSQYVHLELPLLLFQASCFIVFSHV
jgi:hypothetical protein